MIHAVKKSIAITLIAQVDCIYTNYNGALVLNLGLGDDLILELIKFESMLLANYNVQFLSIEDLSLNGNVKVPWSVNKEDEVLLKCSVPKSMQQHVIFEAVPHDEENNYLTFGKSRIKAVLHLDTYVNYPQQGDLGISCSFAQVVELMEDSEEQDDFDELTDIQVDEA